jgi:GNAT superfamily N-acetyltransferase
MPKARVAVPRIRVAPALPEDIPEIVGVRNRAAEDLTERFGGGHWSGLCSERGVAWDMRQGTVVVARRGKSIVGTLKLMTRKPWSIDVSYFTTAVKPWYLTNMAVDPGHQRLGIGRRLMDEAARLVLEWGGDFIRLDAYDDERAGAGPFYARCGYREVARVTYRVVPLIYFERGVA